MKKLTTTMTGLVLAAGSLLTTPALASSHREAPGILNDPAADLTDVYSFKSPSRPTNQVFIFNVSPGTFTLSGTIESGSRPVRTVTTLARTGWITFIQLRLDQAHVIPP